MFHAVVRAKLRRAFADINAGAYDRIVAGFLPKHEHVFPGDHPLADERHSLEATRRWYGRLAELLPDLQFRIRRIVVGGWPWDTSAVVEWTDHFTVGGEPRSNQGVHVIGLRWGKVTRLAVYCDTQKLAEVCRDKARLGLAAAAAEPIAD